MLGMASGIPTANPPDLAIKALWLRPLEVGRIISVLIFSSYVHAPGAPTADCYVTL